MKYSDLIKLTAKQQELSKQIKGKKQIEKSPIDDWSVPISFVKTEEHNNHGDGHQNNICWEMFRDYSWSIGFIWFSQFAGPFRVGNTFISGVMYFKDKRPQAVSELSSCELENIFSRFRFRLKEREGYRLKSRFNLLNLEDKVSLIKQLQTLPNHQLNEYFESGGKIIDFMED